MARAQAQYLRIFSNAGISYSRWQSYYSNATVAWDNNDWIFVPFIADGYTDGISGDESAVSIAAPSTSVVINAFEDAIRNGRFAQLLIYEFDPTVNNTTPQSGQVLIGSFTGQVVGGSSTLTSATLQLGSALSPVGAQIPLRTFTTAIMGKGCRL
jgi:hypothetical protein